MAEVAINDFTEMLVRSRLATKAQVAGYLESWRALENTYDPNDTQSFSKWLVLEDIITQWQSDNIFAGKYKGFFLGSYKLLRVIGTGGMSSVYLAEHTILERKVAIKVLPKSRVTTDTSYLERFMLEAQAAAALDHPNIVRAYDVDSEGGSIYYLVMEYVDGLDLLNLVKKEGPLNYFLAAEYIRQAAVGLDHAHKAGLIHRDMKPANLLVDSAGVVKVLDLGLARFTDEKRASLTVAYDENVLGTADYLAPEQARNSHTVDARADIYGLGCTLYFLLTGHPPFPEGTLPQRIMAHQKKQPKPITDERADAPEILVNICNKMMEKDPTKRQQSALEVADALADWLLDSGQKVDGMTTSGPPGTGTGTGSSTTRRRIGDSGILRGGSDIHKETAQKQSGSGSHTRTTENIASVLTFKDSSDSTVSSGNSARQKSPVVKRGSDTVKKDANTASSGRKKQTADDREQEFLNFLKKKERFKSHKSQETSLSGEHLVVQVTDLGIKTDVPLPTTSVRRAAGRRIVDPSGHRPVKPTSPTSRTSTADRSEKKQTPNPVKRTKKKKIPLEVWIVLGGCLIALIILIILLIIMLK